MFALKNSFGRHDADHCLFKVTFPKGAKIYRKMDIGTMLQKCRYESRYKGKFYGTTKQLLFDINLVSSYFN